MGSEKSNKAHKFDSLTLYTACNSSDSEKKEKAYRVLWQYLYRVAFQMIHDHAESDALAQDSAQNALIRIHEKMAECKDPNAFRSWAKRITTNIVIDELRRRKRLMPISDESETEGHSVPDALRAEDSPDEEVVESIWLANLRQLLSHAPISQRSRRVVLGRYFDDVADEVLAQLESNLADKAVRPSHIQVTRAKNINKLRDWDQLTHFFD